MTHRNKRNSVLFFFHAENPTIVICVLSLVWMKVYGLILFEESRVPPKLLHECNTKMLQYYQLKENVWLFSNPNISFRMSFHWW